MFEDVVPFAKWTTVIHVKITDIKVTDPTAGLDALVAHSGLHNNNGLGQGRTPNELVISSAASGELYVANWSETNHSISVHTTLRFETATDNPSYYSDPYASDDDDASGFVVAGITQGAFLPQTAGDPNAIDALQVWYTRPKGEGWEQKLLFEDDGSRIRTASAAVLVPIEPVGGKKLAWLFVTGFLSEKMVAVQVEL